MAIPEFDLRQRRVDNSYILRKSGIGERISDGNTSGNTGGCLYI